MQSTLPAPAMGADPELLVRPQVGMQRLLAGLVQGLCLYWLYRSGVDRVWPGTVGALYIPLLLVSLLCPPVLIASLGHLPWRRMLWWVGAAVLVVAALGWYDAWRNALGTPNPRGPRPSELLALHLVVALFIAHTLVVAAHAEGRRIASYGGYFDAAWKLAVQLVFSMVFVGGVMLVLNLGGALFNLVKLDFLQKLLREAWFNIPVGAFAFACAMHVTDVRPALVTGIRKLLLVLMAWLLPVATVLVGGFLCSLPFTGLAPLWAIRHAAAVMLGTSALLVLMINAAWQNGEQFENSAAIVVRLAARVAALLLAPLVAFAAVALVLRVRDYGWTDERIVAAAVMAVAACYALGYGWASLQSASLARIAPVNIATAFVVVGLTLALFSPLLDPARISVNSQVARLAAGKVAPDKFDYAYLRFTGARYGIEALKTLAQGAGSASAGATRALALPSPYAAALEAQGPAAVLPQNLVPWPKDAALPEGFPGKLAPSIYPGMIPACMLQPGQRCDVFAADFGGGRNDLLVVGTARFGGAAVFRRGADGAWRTADVLSYELAGCAWFRERLMAGQFRTTAPARRNLEIDGVAVPRAQTPMLEEPEPPLRCPK